MRKAIADIDGNVSTTDSSKTSSTEETPEETPEETNTEVSEDWKNYPCVSNHTEREEVSGDDGEVMYKLSKDGKDYIFKSNGEVKIGEKTLKYKCNGNAIDVIDTKNSEETPVADTKKDGGCVDKDGVITNISCITGAGGFWNNIPNMDGSAERREGVKGLVDALDGITNTNDLKYVYDVVHYFSSKRYQHPGTKQLMPALNQIKDSYLEDEGDDLISDVESVGTTTLDNSRLKDGTEVSPNQLKEIIIKMLS